MEYKGKVDLTLRCIDMVPRRLIYVPKIEVIIASRDRHTVISVQLSESELIVSEIDVAIADIVYRFMVDSTTKHERQYIFHCLPIVEETGSTTIH